MDRWWVAAVALLGSVLLTALLWRPDEALRLLLPLALAGAGAAGELRWPRG